MDSFRNNFFQHHSHLSPEQYRAALKAEAAHNPWARQQLRRDLHDETSMAQSQNQTADCYARAYQGAENCVNFIADGATLGAHRNLMKAHSEFQKGNARGALRQLGAAGAKVVASAALNKGTELAAGKVYRLIRRGKTLGASSEAAVQGGRKFTRSGLLGDAVLDTPRPPAPPRMPTGGNPPTTPIPGRPVAAPRPPAVEAPKPLAPEPPAAPRPTVSEAPAPRPTRAAAPRPPVSEAPAPRPNGAPQAPAPEPSTYLHTPRATGGPAPRPFQATGNDPGGAQFFEQMDRLRQQALRMRH